eukprot:Platyproteum_vivax@DN5850_c0_g1_i1.p1
MALQCGNLSMASTLMMENRVRLMMNPDFEKNERQRGYLPRNPESPFGDFPAEMHRHRAATGAASKPRRPNPNNLGSSCCYTSSPTVKHVGTGGLTSSLLQGHKPVQLPAPKSGAFCRTRVEPSIFRLHYERGDLPLAVDHGRLGNSIIWKVPVPKLDYEFYLPIFFDGVREREDPYRFLSIQGVEDLLNYRDPSQSLVPIIPSLVAPIRRGLNTKDPVTIGVVVKLITKLVLTEPATAVTMVPYFRQILPVFNQFKGYTKNIGDSIDYGQRKNLSLGELILDTLEILEQYGGPNAYINIKYMVPTYESCIDKRP